MLQKLGFAPGINKQVTETGAEGQWFDGDNVRFRYGSPEKIGGWDQLGDNKLTGAGRALHHFDNNNGVKCLLANASLAISEGNEHSKTIDFMLLSASKISITLSRLYVSAVMRTDVSPLL